MTDLDPASPARRHAGWRPTNARFYARLDAIRERQLPPYRPQWLREEQRRAEEERQAKAQVADKLSFDDSTQLVRLRADLAWMRVELAMLALRRRVAQHEPLRSKALHPNGYDSAQPRVPSGNPDGGQWTRVAGGNTGQQRPPDRITGFTKHGINRTINRAITPRAINDALVNPIDIAPQRNGTFQFIGESATVVLDSAGRVITAWPRR